MRIGIIDDLFFSLQQHFIDHGHTIFVLAEGAPRLPPEDFAVFPLKKGQEKQVNQCLTRHELAAEHCDLYIIGPSTMPGHYDYFVSYFQSWPEGSRPTICGYNESALMLEHDRELAFHMNSNFFMLDLFGVKMPKQKAFTDRAKAIAFLKTTKQDYLLKQHANSPQDNDRGRTMFATSDTREAAIAALADVREANPWFRPDGSGGVVLEKVAHGREVSFGAWFNGEEFVGDTYLYEEHKGAWQENIGMILTGEVGTTMTWYPIREQSSRVAQILRAIQPFFVGKCRGMIDLNFILDDNGTLHFIEYTVRFGRPTLEMQIASQGRKFDLAYAWVNDYRVDSCPQLEDLDAKLEELHGEVYVGVTAYAYGVPLIVDSQTEYSLAALPKNKGHDQSAIVPLFTRYDRGSGLWKFFNGERHFLSVGWAHEPELAVRNAYSRLDGYRAYCVVWRPDVGAQTNTTLGLCLKHELV